MRGELEEMRGLKKELLGIINKLVKGHNSNIKVSDNIWHV